MNWGILSKLALLGFFGMVVWMAYPIGVCTFSSSDEEEEGDSETTFHDWAYGDERSDEQGTDSQDGFFNRLKSCYAETPMHTNEPWKIGLTGGLFVGWLLFRRLDRARWVRDLTGAHREV